MGVKCAAGNSVDDLWQTVSTGRATASRLGSEHLCEGTACLGCPDSTFDPGTYFEPHELRRMDRIHSLALSAAIDAFESVKGDLAPVERRGAVVGVGHGATGFMEEQFQKLFTEGPRRISPSSIPIGMQNSVAAHASIRFGLGGPCLTVATACSSGSTAIGQAMRLLQQGDADMVLAGGCDASLTPGGTAFFSRMKALSMRLEDPATASRPFDQDRDGFVLSEGASFLVLERASDAIAQHRGPAPLLLGYGMSSDAHHLVAPDEDGAGAIRAMLLALDDATLRPSDICHVNAHGTSTPMNDKTEARAISEVFGDYAVPVTAPKGSTGHLLGGSGALEAIISILSLENRLVPPISGFAIPDPDMTLDLVNKRPRQIRHGGVALSNSFGFGGHNSCLVLSSAT
jgi:3-oxoacyl-[acyl-carrier-protein] synthase II